MISIEIEYLAELLQWIEEKTNVQLNINESNYHSVACFDLAIEHTSAMLLLARSKRFGSMLALTRIVFEAVGRGLWLRHCATPLQRKKFADGNLGMSFSELLIQIENATDSRSTLLSSLHTGAWKRMNDYTHTGIAQIRSRHSQKAISGNYAPEIIVGALGIGGTLALVAANEVASYTGNETLISEFLAKAEAYGLHRINTA